MVGKLGHHHREGKQVVNQAVPDGGWVGVCNLRHIFTDQRVGTRRPPACSCYMIHEIAKRTVGYYKYPCGDTSQDLRRERERVVFGGGVVSPFSLRIYRRTNFYKNPPKTQCSSPHRKTPSREVTQNYRENN